MAMIGTFVLSAIFLLIFTIGFLGGGKMFFNRDRFVLYFDSSINGLVVGAPVNFRGVKIGEVSNIKVNFDRENFEVTIPVFIEIDPKKFSGLHAADRDEMQSVTNKLIDRGLRARLRLQSFVTGQLAVELSFSPDKESILRGKDTSFIEIPTVPSELEQLTQTLEDLPLDEIFENATNMMQSVTELFGSKETKQIINNMNNLLENIDQIISDKSPYRYEFFETLTQISEASRSTKQLVDFLQQHPESLLYGKK